MSSNNVILCYSNATNGRPSQDIGGKEPLYGGVDDTSEQVNDPSCINEMLIVHCRFTLLSQKIFSPFIHIQEIAEMIFSETNRWMIFLMFFFR